MMGLGSLGHGGGSSSSSSNLSPLAPPFPKPKLNPLGNFAEAPYTFAFTPSHEKWLHLHPPTSVPDSFSNPNLEIDSIRATGLPPGSSSAQPKPYYFSPHSISGHGTQIPSLSPTVATTTATTTHAFPYGQHSETVANTLVEAEPYYHQYPSAAIHDNSPSVVITRPGCDISSISGVAPLERSSQTNYTQSLFGLGYTAPWDGFWNGMTDSEEERMKNLDGSLGWKEKIVAGSSTYKTSLKQGAPAADGLTTCEESSGVWPGKCVASLERDRCIGPEGTDQLDAKCSSVSESNARVTPFKMSRPSVLGPASVLPERPEMHYPQVQSPVSAMKPWGQLNQKIASHGKRFTQLDSCTSDPPVFYPSATYSFPEIIFGSPAIGNSSSAPENTSQSTNVNLSEQTGDGCDNNEYSAGHIPSTSYIKEPRIKVSVIGKEGYGDTRRISNEMEIIHHEFVNSPPMKKDASSNYNPVTGDSLDHLFKAKSELQVTQFDLPHTYSLASAGAGADDSVETSSETFDPFNPAVDSPCWKGAPAFRHSPFGVTEDVTPQLLVKELAGYNVLNFQGPQILSVNAEDTVAVSSPKLHVNLVYNENRCVEDGSSSFQEKPYSEVSNGICFSGGVQELKKEYLLPGNLKSSFKLKSSQIMQSSHEEDKITSARLLAPKGRVADPGMNAKDATQNGSSRVLFHAEQDVSSSSSSEIGVSTELPEPLGGVSDTLAQNPFPKIDARVLVNAMHNLSELLLSTCSSDIDALKEQDSKVLQHAINNLDACVSKKVGLMSPMHKPHFSKSGTSYCPGELTVPLEGRSTVGSQVTREEINDIQSQCDHQSAHEGRMHSTVCGKKQDTFQDFLSLSGDTDFEKDNDMTLAIKKVLKENFHVEEEPLPQILLYKNLWLEAEASLCSMKYKARFARMKIEMEKCKRHQAKGKPNNVENLSSLKVSYDLNSDDVLAPKVKESSTNISTQDTSQSIIDSRAEDVEASVMSRFQILKHRFDNSSFVNKGQQLPDSIDVGPYAGMTETTSSPCWGSVPNVGMKAQPTGIVDLGSAERRNPWPFIRGRLEDGSLEVRKMPDVQYHSVCYTEDESGLDLDVSERQEMVKEFLVPPLSDEPGNHLRGGGSHSPSSDWEHVLKEELTWQD